jgi:dTMP kinase
VYIAIEGLDGSGGTTQLDRLATAFYLREPARPVLRTREPSDLPVGKLIRALLAGGEIGDAVFPYLFAADRRDHLDRVVLPALACGEVVLSDRCMLSSLAYQAPALGLTRVGVLNDDFRPPDLTVMLDLPVEDCLARIEARRAQTGAVLDRFETLDRLRETAAAYDAAIGWGASRGWAIARIDARGTPAEVAARVAEAVWPS